MKSKQKKRNRIWQSFVLLLLCLSFVACSDSPETISAPQNVRVENGVLLWDEVEYADGYYVYIDGKEFHTKENCLAIEGFKETKTYEIELRAYSDSGYISSYTDMSYAGKYTVPTPGMKFVERTMWVDETSTREIYYNVEQFAADVDGLCVVPVTYLNKPVMDITNIATKSNCDIKTMFLPNSVTKKLTLYHASNSVSFGGSFAYFPNLEKIILELEEDPWVISEGNCLIERETNTLVVGGMNGVIPEYVTKMGERAYMKRNIKTIVVPENVTEIDYEAFKNCTLLEKAVLPKNLAGELDFVFDGCTSLTEVNIPNGLKDLVGTFYNCTSLKTVTVPAMKDVVAFANCTSLENVTLEEGIGSLSTAGGGFGGGAKLGCFENCTSLTEIKLPSSIKIIWPQVFAGCTSLEWILIGESPLEIKDDAFLNCTALENVYYVGTEEDWAEKVTVSETGNDSFLSATRYYYSETEPTEAGNFWHYVDGVPVKWE